MGEASVRGITMKERNRLMEICMMGVPCIAFS